jgi:ASC-1-like (ASCH) protein
MIREMKLFEEPFEKIKSGQKDIEVRLFDQKRREIKIGDKIIFHKLPDKNENISVMVIGFSVFSNFKELFSNFDNNRFGNNNLTIDQQLERIRKIYSQEEENKIGVVGIHIKLIS